MKTEDLLNWGALSRFLTNSRQGVRKNKIPLKHKDFISGLLSKMDDHLNSFAKADAGGKKNKDTTNGLSDETTPSH